ncbi:Chemotaxis protein methyltransferase CheR [Minicystis rosea]|nr:Chemotaxis protein methyltransferase CheR [Minicystis rosea]
MTSALREATVEDVWQRALDDVREGVGILDAEGRVRRENRAFRTLLGLDEASHARPLADRVVSEAGVLVRDLVDGRRQAVEIALEARTVALRCDRRSDGSVAVIFVSEVAPRGRSLPLAEAIQKDEMSTGRGTGAELEVRPPLGAPEGDAPPRKSHATRVLVVEDNLEVLEMIEIALSIAGYCVETASDGMTGLELALETRPDVALVDVGLPGLDGYHFAERVRAEPACAGVYLVAVTGYGGPRIARGRSTPGSMRTW